jgi:imidazole glycerol-phosphate synthase subunit HisH
MGSRAVVIVDLGIGNLRSVARALERSGADPTITSDPHALARAEAVVVPGQGAFRDCALGLENGFREALLAFIACGKPYLGICMGMQVLFESSEESPGSVGLGLFRGHVRRFARDLSDAARGTPLKVPHMGWNQVMGDHPLLPKDAWFYFVHSYYCVPEDGTLTVGSTDYGAPFCTAIARDNVFACQFHPEKSQEQGKELLDRFVRGL